MIILSLSIILNLFLFFNYKIIANKFDLLDRPDHNRKIHSTPTPYVGGVFVFINFLFFFILQNINLLDSNGLFISLENFIISTVFFIVGVLDDKKNLNPYFKISILISVILIFLLIEPRAILNNLRFSFINKELNLGSMSLFISILCFIIFINALNFFDGLNFQVGAYLIIFFIFLNIISFDIFLIILLVPLIIFIFYNFNGKIFLGNNGSHFLGFIISYICISLYNDQKIIFSDQVVLLMIVPGIDMLRLVFFRFKLRKNPFFPDWNHMHHLIPKKIGKLKYFILLSVLILVPNILYLQGFNFLYLISVIICTYFYFIFIHKRNAKIFK